MFTSTGALLRLELEDELLAVHLPVHDGAAVLQVKVPLDLGEEQVGDQEYLGGGEDQVDGKVVVGVGRVVVDPQLPGNGGQKYGRHHHPSDHKGLKKTNKIVNILFFYAWEEIVAGTSCLKGVFVCVTPDFRPLFNN